MAALESRILTEILRSGEMSVALRAGLQEGHFKDPDSRAVFKYLLEHWQRRDTVKTLPSLGAVQRSFPSFQMTARELEDPNEKAALVSLVRELKMASFESDARSLASYFQELVDQDPQDAVKVMMKHLSELSAMQRTSEKLGIGDVIERAVNHYDGAYKGLIYGIPWPWKCLTEDTLGKRAGDLTIFYARMKQMKTWVMLYCAIYDFMINRCRVIIWSKEMSKDKMALRIASLIAQVDYQLFKKGKLPPMVYERACVTLESLLAEDSLSVSENTADTTERKRQLILLCGRDAPPTLEELRTEIQHYSPDVVYLDSFYHLQTARMEGIKQRWHQIAILAEDVKTMAEEERIPVIAVHQANRSGEKTHGETLADMSDSDVLAREADLIIRILKRRGKELYEEDYEVEREKAKREAATLAAERPKPGKVRIKMPRKAEEAIQQDIQTQDNDVDDDIPRTGAELALVLGGNREGVLNAFTIHAVPGYNFEFISSDYALSDIEDWIKEDESGKADKAASKKPGPSKPDFSQETFKNFRKGGK